jgi:hypothetical protein
MEQYNNKNLLLSAILVTQILLFFSNIFPAFAQGDTTTAPASGTQAESSCTTQDGTCEAIDCPPANSIYLVTTIIEEGMGKEPAESEQPPDTKIRRCFRVTTKADNKSSYSSSPCSPSDTISCKPVQVIFTKTGPALLYSYIGMIYKWAAGIIGIVSVLFLVWGGIEISTAGDNTGKIDEAKKRIIQSITGLVLLFLSGIILYTINPNFFTA